MVKFLLRILAHQKAFKPLSLKIKTNIINLNFCVTDIISDESSAMHMVEIGEQQSKPSSSASVHEADHQSPRHQIIKFI